MVSPSWKKPLSWLLLNELIRKARQGLPHLLRAQRGLTKDTLAPYHMPQSPSQQLLSVAPVKPCRLQILLIRISRNTRACQREQFCCIPVPMQTLPMLTLRWRKRCKLPCPRRIRHITAPLPHIRILTRQPWLGYRICSGVRGPPCQKNIMPLAC